MGSAQTEESNRSRPLRLGRVGSEDVEEAKLDWLAKAGAGSGEFLRLSGLEEDDDDTEVSCDNKCCWMGE